MRRKPPLRFLHLGLLVTLAAACAPGDTEETDAMPRTEEATTPEEALDALREAWVAGYNAHDVEAVTALYADSAWVLQADMSALHGRAEIAASLDSAMASSPTASVTTTGRMVMGDQAVARGAYQVDVATPDGEAMGWSGTWIAYFARTGEDWKIETMLTNYDADPPEGVTWSERAGEPPPENSTMTDLIASYEAAFSAGDADAVAALYSEDAAVAFSFGPELHGRQAVAEDLRARFAEGGGTLDVHGVGTVDLDATHKADAGWYEIKDPASGTVVQSGRYFNLVERAPDGSWTIQWGVYNGRPEEAEAGMGG